MIVIIGAGISGLSAAYFLQKKQVPYVVLEANSNVGGVIQTTREEGNLLELGPNSLLCDEENLAFLTELGLEPELLTAAEVNKNRFIFKNGKYRKLPSSPPSLLFNSFFSWKAKWQIFNERKVTSKSPEGETVEQFFCRRFGAEVTKWAVNPFISGIYAGDPQKLWVAETFPLLVELEKKYGSVLKGFMKRKGTTARKATYSFKQGLSALPQALAGKLNLRLQTQVKHIKPVINGWEVVLSNEIISASSVILAVPATSAAHLLAPYFPDEARVLETVHYPPMTVVHTSFRREDVKHTLNGFGGLNPKAANRFAAGSIWSSSIFEGRSRKGEVLITSFVGGSQYESHALLKEEEILANTVKELKEAYQILGDPVFTHLYKWPKAIPQYDAAMPAVHKVANGLTQKGAHICANWLGGVSVIDCIRKGKELAEKFS